MLSSRVARGLAPLVLGVPCVAAVAIYGELSVEALFAVTATGAALAVLGLALRAGEASAPLDGGGRRWLIWVTAALSWELVTLVSTLPTLSDLGDVVLRHPPARAAATVAWLVAGAWLLSRPVRGEEG